MRNKFTILLLLAVFPMGVWAQSPVWRYATMENQLADKIKAQSSQDIQVLETHEGLSAVYLNLNHGLTLENRGSRGPGFIIRKDEISAIESLYKFPSVNKSVLDFTITEDAYVQEALSIVEAERIGDLIILLENYGTRFHDKPQGIQAANDLKEIWQTMANDAGRTDVSVEFYEHNFSDQKSVIFTFPGVEDNNEVAILGAHLDSGDYWNPDNAPGADDNASGVATITEVLYVLLANDFRPLKTVQIMAFAAEEIGLMGAADIAETYMWENKNVLGMMNLDMVNYHGSQDDVFLVSDPNYVSPELNLFVVELLEHYNSSGVHALTYQHSECGYACSDHAAWSDFGFMAVYPFEASEDEYNPYYHSPQDTYANMGNDASHAAKFAKLGLEFIIELAKTSTMGIKEFNAVDLNLTVQNNQLVYRFGNLNSKIHSLDIVDVSARKLIHKENLSNSGSIYIQTLPKGVYVAIFKDVNGKVYTRKFMKK